MACPDSGDMDVLGSFMFDSGLRKVLLWFFKGKTI
jgi:hypothetical protein